MLRNGNSYLSSKKGNTGRAEAYFKDRQQRAKMMPGGSMASAKAGVDVVFDCP